MIYELNEIKKLPMGSEDGKIWTLARPLDGPLISVIRERVAAAWEIIKGRACAVRWY